MAVVQDSRANEVAVQEVVHLQQRLALQVVVRHLQVHLVRLLRGLHTFSGIQALLLFLQLHLADIAYQDRCTDDAQHT